MIPVIKNHEMSWKIRVTFSGKLPPRQYITPDIRHNNPGWGDEIFNRTLESIEFFLPTGHRLAMSGMEQYNFFVEAVQSTKSRGRARIKAFWFLGKLPGQNLVEMWRVGDKKVIRERRPWGREWGGSATRGWKPGVAGKPVSAIFTRQ